MMIEGKLLLLFRKSLNALMNEDGEKLNLLNRERNEYSEICDEIRECMRIIELIDSKLRSEDYASR